MKIINLLIFIALFLPYSSWALDIGTASDACVASNNCNEANVVQALLLTQDVAVYFAFAAALFFGFNLGLRFFPK